MEECWAHTFRGGKPERRLGWRMEVPSVCQKLRATWNDFDILARDRMTQHGGKAGGATSAHVNKKPAFMMTETDDMLGAVAEDEQNPYKYVSDDEEDVIASKTTSKMPKLAA